MILVFAIIGALVGAVAAAATLLAGSGLLAALLAYAGFSALAVLLTAALMACTCGLGDPSPQS